MMFQDSLSRRGFLAVAAASAASLRAQNKKHVPVGLLIYAVLADWKKDFNGTLTAVAQMGYEGVELTQYESWTPARAKRSPGSARFHPLKGPRHAYGARVLCARRRHEG